MKQPPMQNIPVRTEEGKLIRETLVPHSFITADFSELEKHCLVDVTDPGTGTLFSKIYPMTLPPRLTDQESLPNRRSYRKAGSSKGVSGVPGRPKRDKNKTKQQRAARKRK